MSWAQSHIVFADLVNELEVQDEICTLDYTLLLNKCSASIYSSSCLYIYTELETDRGFFILWFLSLLWLSLFLPSPSLFFSPLCLSLSSSVSVSLTCYPSLPPLLLSLDLSLLSLSLSCTPMPPSFPRSYMLSLLLSFLPLLSVSLARPPLCSFYILLAECSSPLLP